MIHVRLLIRYEVYLCSVNVTERKVIKLPSSIVSHRDNPQSLSGRVHHRTRKPRSAYEGWIFVKQLTVLVTQLERTWPGRSGVKWSVENISPSLVSVIIQSSIIESNLRNTARRLYRCASARLSLCLSLLFSLSERGSLVRLSGHGLRLSHCNSTLCVAADDRPFV